ncbi:MAG: EthD family reductase [Actinobacteria bacterium]|nr:EthD family reductase [Actinomycetota bacterium]
MFKAIILLTRGADQTPDDFRRWWLEQHAPLARRLPGLRGLVFNLVPPNLDGGTAPLYDGVSELWFDSRDAFDAAYATDLGKQVASDSLEHVSGRLRLFVEEHVLERHQS